jgi:hypothetical protein
MLIVLQQQIDECCQDKFQGWGLRRLQRLEQWAKALRLLSLQCGKNIRPEHLWVIVFLIQGEPGHQRLGGWP